MSKLKNRAVAEQRVRDYIIDNMQKLVINGQLTLADAVTMQEQALDQIRPGTDWSHLYDNRMAKTDHDRLYVATSLRVQSMHIDALSALNSQLKLYKK